MTLWEAKAHKIIADYCRQAWKSNGKRQGYSVPAIADALVKALGIKDGKAREHEVKRLFEIERVGAWSLI